MISGVRHMRRAVALNEGWPGSSLTKRKLYWAGARAATPHAFDPAMATTSAGMGPDGSVVSLWLRAEVSLSRCGSGLFGFDPSTDALSFMALPPHDSRHFWFNGGRRDRRGYFHVGLAYAPLGPQDDQLGASNIGPVWRDEGPGEWRPATPPVRFSNPLAPARGRRTMYHADTVDGGGDGSGPAWCIAARDGFHVCAVFRAKQFLRWNTYLPSAELISRCFASPQRRSRFHRARAADPGPGALFTLEASAPSASKTFFRSPQHASPS